MNFQDNPIQANFRVYNKKEWIENISFNYDRTESDLVAANENVVSDYKTIESIASLLILLSKLAVRLPRKCCYSVLLLATSRVNMCLLHKWKQFVEPAKGITIVKCGSLPF
jgi:hypothetical protein